MLTLTPDPYRRGSGNTAKQLTDAPQGAAFIWCTPDLSYPKALARFLDREDLRIYSPGILSDGGRRLMGCRFPAIVLDHAARLEPREREALEDARQGCCGP